MARRLAHESTSTVLAGGSRRWQFGISLAAALLLGMAVIARADDGAVRELRTLAAAMEPFSVRVIGLPVSTPEWIFIDKPFWNETVGELSAGKVRVRHLSVTEVNVQPGDVFSLTSRGLFDIADVTANYGSGEVPALDGFDLAGVATTTDMIRGALSAYAPAADNALQARFDLKLLGQGMSGAQVFFCRGEVRRIDDLKGRKIRVSTSTLADFLSGIGATPISLAFGEVLPAMQRGVVDCVITGAMGGYTAKLYEVADTLYTLQVGWAPKVRFVNGRYWRALDERQQAWLMKATAYYYRHVSDPIQIRNLNDGVWCLTGNDRCTLAGERSVEKAYLELAEPGPADLEVAQQAVETHVLPAFARVCGHACVAEWNETVGAALGVSIGNSGDGRSRK